MSNKPKGQLTVTGKWARHLRPTFKRVFWKGERTAGKNVVRVEATGGKEG
jgi:hypothetical protein